MFYIKHSIVIDKYCMDLVGNWYTCYVVHSIHTRI